MQKTFEKYKACAALLDNGNESKVALWGLNATQLTGAESVPGSARYQISSSPDYISDVILPATLYSNNIPPIIPPSHSIVMQISDINILTHYMFVFISMILYCNISIRDNLVYNTGWMQLYIEKVNGAYIILYYDQTRRSESQWITLWFRPSKSCEYICKVIIFE